jgi:hypothetical protein
MSKRDCEYVFKLGVQIHAILTAMEVTALLRAPSNFIRGIFKLLWPKGYCRVKFGFQILMMVYSCGFREFNWK